MKSVYLCVLTITTFLPHKTYICNVEVLASACLFLEKNEGEKRGLGK
jgi:hypothetical protein